MARGWGCSSAVRRWQATALRGFEEGVAGGADAAEFHGPDGGDGEDVGGDVEGVDAGDVGGDEGGFESFAHLAGVGLGGGVGGVLADGFHRGDALLADIDDGAEVLVGKEGKEDGDEDAGDGIGPYAEGGERQEAADDDDVQRPVPLQGVGAFEEELDEFGVGHGGPP